MLAAVQHTARLITVQHTALHSMSRNLAGADAFGEQCTELEAWGIGKPFDNHNPPWLLLPKLSEEDTTGTSARTTVPDQHSVDGTIGVCA